LIVELEVRRAKKKLAGTVELPGDKSQTHRALILALLAEGPVVLRNPLQAGVTQPTVALLEALGRTVERTEDTITIGRAGPPRSLGTHSCGRSGTTLRLAMGALAGMGIEAVLEGDASLSRRPMERVASPLRALGADIRTTAGTAPIRIGPARLRGADVALAVPSAQVQTAVLFAALQAEGTTQLRWTGSLRDHTARLLGHLGLPIRSEGPDQLVVEGPASVPGFERTLPGDPSAAAFLAGAALLVEGTVELPGVGVNPGRMGFFEVIAGMGAGVTSARETLVEGEPVADLTVRGAHLHGAEVGGDQVVRMIDEFPVLAAVAVRARGSTVVKDAAELRLKESDRIEAMVQAFGELGVRVVPFPDGFVLEGRQRVRGGTCDPRGDHRLAMALALLGLVAEQPVVVRSAEVIAESFPDFPRALSGLGAHVEIRG
jgi:3-phosphoshikimate 1-carboxyvinyltransferase